MTKEISNYRHKRGRDPYSFATFVANISKERVVAKELMAYIYISYILHRRRRSIDSCTQRGVILHFHLMTCFRFANVEHVGLSLKSSLISKLVSNTIFVNSQS